MGARWAGEDARPASAHSFERKFSLGIDNSVMELIVARA